MSADLEHIRQVMREADCLYTEAEVEAAIAKVGEQICKDLHDKNPVVLTYRTDGFNIFNRTSFGGVNGTVGNANFGRPTGPQNGARLITMGLRLEF